jgi:4-cresol dehydrogenase (hydroxylating)
MKETAVHSRTAAEELNTLLGADHLVTSEAELARAGVNTLGVRREVPAIVRPSSTAEVQGVVEIANRHGLALYPISRGRNIGYGDAAPVGDGQVIVDLSRMTDIRSYDAVHGKAVIEPGVTQQQLYEFLEGQGGRFWMDVTGSGLDSSIVGNTLEGGFGHTPVGNRRNLISGAEVVLGNGEVLEAGSFPALGPDLNGILVQSNFGIVTALEVTLFAAPECYQSFMIRIDSDSQLEVMVDLLSELRRDGTLTSLVHLANAMRSLISTIGLPDEFEDRLITPDDAVRFMSTPVAKSGYWTAIGGLYGTAGQVRAKRADIRRAFRGQASVQFLDDRKVGRLNRLFNTAPLRGLGWLDKPRRGIAALEYIHGLGRGVPSDRGIHGVQWRVTCPEDVGLFWCSPTFPASGDAARQATRIAERLFGKHGFELPITLTFVTPDRVVATTSCNFNRNDPEEKRRAHALFYNLHDSFEAAGIPQYRAGILGQRDITYPEQGRFETLNSLKTVLDPKGVIAPGRYGLGGRDG